MYINNLSSQNKMLIGKRICCIVTARKNSKGINNKNLKIIDGKPLIYYPIRAAINSKFIDKILFNSDSDVMIKKAKSYGAEISFANNAFQSNVV